MIDWDNLTNATTTWEGMAQQTNNYSGSFLGIGILIATFFVAFTNLYLRDGWKSALIGSSWITTLFSFMLYLLRIVSYDIVFYCILLAGVSTIISYFSD